MAPPRKASYPNASYGYWRGWIGGSGGGAGGEGSGAGMPAGGANSLTQGLGSVGSMGGAWEPHIWYLFGFIVVEMIVFHLISRVLR